MPRYHHTRRSGLMSSSSPRFTSSSAPCQREFMCTKAWGNLTPINKARCLHMGGVWLLTPSALICVRCVFRSTRSASRSTCLTGLKSTTTKVPPSVSTAGLCCGDSPSRGSNVRVRGGSFLFWFVCFVWFYILCLQGKTKHSSDITDIKPQTRCHNRHFS